MEWITALWLPILVSGVAVFLAAFLAWMVFPHHKSDWKGVPDESALGEAVRSQGMKPGHYTIPHCANQKDWSSPEMREKYEKGPVVYMTSLPSGIPAMGPKLLGSFVLYVVVSCFVGYLAYSAVPPGADFLRVFRFAAVAAILGYTTALVPNAIWFARGNQAVKDVIDGVAFGLITGAIFAVLWP